MPTLTLFAGPNGSGKSTIVDRIRLNDPYPYAAETYYLNADELEKQLKENPYCNLRHYGLQGLLLSDWNRFVLASTLTIKICQEKQITTDYLLTCVKLVHGTIIIKVEPADNAPEHIQPDSYVASLIIDFIRYALIDARQSFAFETVMSHPSKLEIMRQAADMGFAVHLYYVTTRDPDINIARVRNRVVLGGHPVNEELIRKRYFGSLANLADALRWADEAYLFDNSTDGQPGIEVARKQGNTLTVSVDEVPDWYVDYVETRL